MEILDSMLNGLIELSSKLDWVYIFTFILIAHAVNTLVSHINTDRFTWLKWLKDMSDTWRVFIVGVIYAIALFFIRQKDGSTVLIESFFISISVAMLIHGLILRYLIEWLTKIGKKD